MRSGTRTQCKQRWSRKGRRPVCRMNIGYPFCYLYAALCPSTSHLVCLILPDMSKASFCVFCQFFSEQVQAVWGTGAVLMICDGAGRIKKKYACKSFTLQHLPPYCPELNPVERFFEELRKELSNQVYHDIEAAENHLSEILQHYLNNKNKIIQLTNYEYIRTD